MTAPRQPVAQIERWGVVIRYGAKSLSGAEEQWAFEHLKPVIFTKRREAEAWIAREYGYTRSRPDLRAYPHGWLMPQARRCKITVAPA